MTRSLPRAVVVLATLLGAAGCAFRTPTPNVPAGVVDGAEAEGPARLEVASITVVRRDGDIDAETADSVSAQTAKILADAARKSDVGGAAEVDVLVELGPAEDHAAAAMRRDGMAAIAFLVLAPAGVAFENQEVAVDLMVRRGGRSFQGRGTAARAGSIYASARKRALAVAIDHALADADRAANPPASPSRGEKPR